MLGEYPIHDRINKILFGIREPAGHETSIDIACGQFIAERVLWSGNEDIQTRIRS